MDNSFTYVSYAETGYFSKLVTDYLANTSAIQPFYKYAPTPEGLDKAIKERADYPVNRKLLVDTLNGQYSTLNVSEKTRYNIDALLQENTFTICTAHQPNLLTGYLYFIYKILHAIKLADQLNKKYTDKTFVPVYYMGSEDNDLEELGTFRFRGDKYVWDGGGQTGAVGRMNTKSLKPLLTDLFKFFGPPGKNYDTLQAMLTQAYLKHDTIAAATQYLVNELFGKYGLIVLNPDDAALKSTFVPVMEDELLNQNSIPLLTSQIEKLGTQYKIQAHPRPINLFYLADQVRERIEQKDDKWIVLNTDVAWNKEELIKELHEHPERFSPNVMLRGLYQETILPDVAFIGGGAEVAYWMQLKTLFEQYKVFYPSIHLRQSALWIDKLYVNQRKQLELSVQDIFKQEAEIVRMLVTKHAGNEWHTGQEMTAMEEIIKSLKGKATTIDPTLKSSADAVLARIKHQVDALEKKMLRAEKKKMSVQLSRLTKLKAAIFPNNSLQERIENFSEYYLQYGPQFMDTILEGMDALSPHFLVVNNE